MHKSLFSIPADVADAITPNDTTVFQTTYRALYIGTAGNVTVIPRNQTTPVTFWGLQDGTILPVSAKSVLSTGTTAGQIIGLR